MLIMFKYPDASLKDALINNDNHEENIKRVAKIYKVKNPEDLEIIFKRLTKSEVSKNEEVVSLVESYTSKKYRYAHLNALVMAFI